jgi:NMD protein affecting ribosome stability and mRNA decay
MPKHCPTCNKSSDEIKFYGDFCYDCAGKKLLSNIGHALEVERCKRCGRVRIPGAYENFDGRSLQEIVARKFGKYEISVLKYDENSVLVEFAETSERGTLAAEKELQLDYKKILCDRCYKKASNYHEAVVQLRGNRESIERMLKRLQNYIERGGEFITKIEEADNGINVYVSSKRATAEFIAHARLHPVVSYTLMGLKNGKKVYKNTYAIHF